MNPAPRTPTLALPVLTRYGCMLAAALASGMLHLGMLGAFDRASPSLWLEPTDNVLLAQARCDRLPDRGERTRCKQSAVQRTLAELKRSPAVASR